jgi:phospholipase D1/2
MNYYLIVDVQLSDLNTTIFSEQDFNNSRCPPPPHLSVESALHPDNQLLLHDDRFIGFHKVDHQEQNNVSRNDHSRMRWSNVALSLIGPTVRNQQRQFPQRWNFYYSIYQVCNQLRFQPHDEPILHEHGHNRSKCKGKVQEEGQKIGKRFPDRWDNPLALKRPEHRRESEAGTRIVILQLP